MSDDEVISAFEDNARNLKACKNGNVLYHEILSLSPGYRLEGDALARAVGSFSMVTGHACRWMQAVAIWR